MCGIIMHGTKMARCDVWYYLAWNNGKMSCAVLPCVELCRFSLLLQLFADVLLPLLKSFTNSLFNLNQNLN